MCAKCDAGKAPKVFKALNTPRRRGRGIALCVGKAAKVTKMTNTPPRPA